MKNKFIAAYMDVAARFAELSSAVRLKVGAIIVKDNRIISIGYNGMPSGWDNNCEEKVYKIDGWLVDEDGCYDLKTRPEVLHAETNAIAKLAQSAESGANATLFVTHAPCIDCAKLVYQSGISSVYYRHQYRNDAGIHFLEKAGIEVIHYDANQDIHSDS